MLTRLFLERLRPRLYGERSRANQQTSIEIVLEACYGIRLDRETVSLDVKCILHGILTIRKWNRRKSQAHTDSVRRKRDQMEMSGTSG